MKRWLVLGGSGTLGRAISAEIRQRGDSVVTAARRGADLPVDIRQTNWLSGALEAVKPDGIINSAAIVDLKACEADPELAHAVNAAPVGDLARWSRETGGALIQISTDHYFDGDGDAAHDEDAPVTLLNEYARSKFAGEEYALEAPGALVVRTNVTGHNPGRETPTFADWAAASIRERRRLTLFEDFFTSTIDAESLAAAVLDLHAAGASGVLNVASSDVSSKWEFVHDLAAAMGIVLDWAERGTARGMTPPRALSLGLDVRRAEAILGRPLPDLLEVCAALADTIEGNAPEWNGTNNSKSMAGRSRGARRPILSPILPLRMTGS
ncbi:MAG: sugar nucleotide-binding protein [Euryhalocaulis sp.]|uniref:SDR family oxidoreductase n=1 Tax=Euryhalocaulis sp. TaxID=2744307 RepID=UPI0017AAABEB|nr:sugar nucleotide-binding protein [Euryhalocaulis sp.]MBA4801471.1 sugar nucleotide-binding protein [Euryhalocaulis sp.]